MNRAIFGVLASAFLLSVGVAHAEKPKKVVVEQFSGTGAEKFKKLVQAELGRQGVEVVSDKKRAAIEADLGLLQVSDNYAAVAKELKAEAFIDGTVTGSKKLTARLKVKGPDGSAGGGASWTAPNEKKLMAAIDATLAKKLSAVFSGGAAAKEEAVAEAPAKVEEVAEERPKRKSKKAAEESEEKPAEKSDEGTSVAASAAEDEGPASPYTKLDLALGAHVYNRKFAYNQSVAGDQRNYTLPVVSAPSISLDYFFLPFLGISVGGEYSVALISEDRNGDRFRTSSFGFNIGAKGRYHLGTQTELTATAGYGINNFKLTPAADEQVPPSVAGVDYSQIRAGVGVRIGLTDSLAIIGGGNYLYLLGMGEIATDKYFKFATGRGGDGFAGIALGLPWMAGLEARLTADIRRYVFSMNSISKDTRIAGGATDQYIGANIALGFRR